MEVEGRKGRMRVCRSRELETGEPWQQDMSWEAGRRKTGSAPALDLPLPKWTLSLCEKRDANQEHGEAPAKMLLSASSSSTGVGTPIS